MRVRTGRDPRVRARDGGLARITGLTRWLGVSAVALVGLLAGYISQSKPGRPTGQHPGSSAGVPPAAAVPRLDTGASSGLAAPAQAPAPASAPPVVVSGGS